MANKGKINDEYEEKDLRTHIYENSDTYAGSDQMIKAPLPMMDETQKRNKNKIIIEEIKFRIFFFHN